MIRFLKKRWVYHSLIWLSSYLFFVFLVYMAEGNTASLISCLKEPLSFFIPVIPTTYLAFAAKEYLFDRRQYLFYVIAAAAIVVLGVILYEVIRHFDTSMSNTRFQNVMNFIFLQLFAVGIQYFKRGIVNQYQIQELTAKTAITELNSLKAQLNPHFLFNTLNNIYGMNQIDSEKGSEMIMELSEVMRYHLEFSKEGKVKLADEIQLLQSYIKLEKLRLRKTCDVQINFNEADGTTMISPLLFIPFVENAFKHGTHPTKECFIHIDLKTTKEKLLFTIKNSIILNRKVVKTNIGLKNTQRRLELIYPERHKLNISQNEGEHLVEMHIEL